MKDDLDDLLDSSPSPRRGRPPKPPTRDKSMRSLRAAQRKADPTTTMRLIQALHAPVSITFLSDALGMDRKTVRDRLATLPPIGSRTGKTPLYDFRQALPFLVKPRIDVAKVIAGMSANDLPPSLQKDVWDARLKAQKWMAQAGDLWATDDVLEVLGTAFQRLKTTTQLWIDQVSDHHSLPAEARQELVRLVDALTGDLHKTLVEMPKEKATKPQINDLDEEV